VKFIDLTKAQTSFDQLLEQVALGEEFTITEHGQPIARLIPPATKKSSPSDVGQFVFGANDFSDGQAFITLEPSGGSLTILKGGSVFLRLRPGIDIKQAEELAQQLNELIEGINYTR